MDMNSVMVSGRLGADPESRGKSDDNPIASFRICSNSRKKEGNDWVDVPNWFGCTAFGWQAKNVLEKARKGDELVLVGKLREETWSANGEKKSRVALIADNVKIVPKAQAPASQAGAIAEEVPF